MKYKIGLDFGKARELAKMSLWIYLICRLQILT
jgi:hypothetical protein